VKVRRKSAWLLHFAAAPSDPLAQLDKVDSVADIGTVGPPGRVDVLVAVASVTKLRLGDHFDVVKRYRDHHAA
jgi:hypothetical protein